jgi:hypothetical protein
MPENLLNWGLLANPANWLVVFLMLAVAAMVVTVINASWGR